MREAFGQVPFVADIDDSFGHPTQRARLSIDQDNLEFHKVEEADVYSTIQGLYGQTTVGYSHRGEGRQPIPIVMGLAKNNAVLNENALATPVPANALPGARGVVELGDKVRGVVAHAAVVEVVDAVGELAMSETASPRTERA